MARVTDWAGRHLHLVGIGGAGMSGLARVARSLGATVTGSDARARPVLERLRADGISIAVGHTADNVPAGCELIYSAAVGTENCERVRGRELGLSERGRGALLAELTALRRCIAVAGTHGKTTTSAMIVRALHGAGIDAGYVIGAELLETGTNADWGSGEWLVVETDESDRSLLEIAPEVGVLTNVELEHVDAYATRDELLEVFGKFLAGASRTVVWDRPDLLEVAGEHAQRFDAPAPQLGVGVSRFRWRGHEVSLPVPGEHNARNAAAALEASLIAGADPAAAAFALGCYPGTARRLQRLGAAVSGAAIYDDYAHHPTEVRATLAAARTFLPRRLIAVLEPFSHTRARLMLEEFGQALALADVAVVLDVVRTRSDAGAPVSGATIADAATEAGCPIATWLPEMGAAEAHLRATLAAGDLCVAMGASRVDELATRLVCDPSSRPPGRVPSV